MKEVWYLLFDGDSPDGRGTPAYAGRTLDVKKAMAHHQKCKADPYCTGYTVIVSDKRHSQPTGW